MTTPWPDLLRLAATRFRISPEVFWRLSLVEWRALTAEGAAPALDRAGFEALARAHPDQSPTSRYGPPYPGHRYAVMSGDR